jgi:chlorite dismutase
MEAKPALRRAAAGADAPALELREVGAPVNGAPQTSERRLFLQFQAFGGCQDPEPLKRLLEQHRAEGVLYLDVNDPQGVGVLLLSEEPEWFVREGRALLTAAPFAALRRRPELAMLGRTYSTGREADLEDWLLRKPRRAALNPRWPWAVWYPLRRKPEFALLPRDEQTQILSEHARLGMAFGQAGFAADIRLACHGLDANDNEFILGLVGPQLYYLSALVQEMRKSQQTARYIQSMGPFFVGRACWQSPAPAA